MTRSLDSEKGHVLDRSELPWWRLQDFVSEAVVSTEHALGDWKYNAEHFNELLTDDSHRRLQQYSKNMLEMVR